MADTPSGSAFASDAAADGPTQVQWIAVSAFTGAIGVAVLLDAPLTLGALHIMVVTGFGIAAGSKLLLALVGRPPLSHPPVRRDLLPTYTILAPLYREGAVARQLIEALSEIDYPRAKLQVILVLEKDDEETLDALAWLRLPPVMEVLVKGIDGPQTKPNALNAALVLARGEHVVVYDAEDRPHAKQLLEAAAAFAADPALVCVQAPLRIANANRGFLARQFALEYAGQFEGVIPGLVHLGSTFPLGGTSNHFRTAMLRKMGGWDAYNVTEDADLGFRLGARCKVGLIAPPTLEDAPLTLDDWLPQRTRWVKGYMQTWGVHMRQPFAGGLNGFAALQATLGLSILGAALHGPLLLLLIAGLLTDAFQADAPLSVWADLGVLACGWAAAVAANRIGARRAGIRMSVSDALGALLYWPLQSIAFGFALEQLVFAPFHWDKTAHAPSQLIAEPRPLPLDVAQPWSVSPAA